MGRSLLVRSAVQSSAAIWPTTILTTIVSSALTATRSRRPSSQNYLWARYLTRYLPGHTLTDTYSYPGDGVSRTGSHTFTDTFFGSQTLTVHNTYSWGQAPTYGASRTVVVGSSGSATENHSYSPTHTYTHQRHTIQSASYTTTTWWPWQSPPGGSGSMLEEADGTEAEPVRSLGTLDAESDVLDARTRQGAALRLLLGAE